MNYSEIEKMALSIFPDEHIPVGSGSDAIIVPNMVVSHEKERAAFVFGFQTGFRKGMEHERMEKYKPVDNWK